MTHNVRLNITNHQKNANQNLNDISPHAYQNGSKCVGEDVKKRVPLCTVGENVNLCSHYGKQFGDSSKNKNRATMHSNLRAFLVEH